MCIEGETYKVSTTGPYQCFKANLAATVTEGSSALLAATGSSEYKTSQEMGYRCCGMTDYFMQTGNTFSHADDYASSTTCTAPANPDNGAYSGSCAAGSTLYSGNRCTPTCDSGYTVSGVTTCVAGAITTTATCVSTETDPCAGVTCTAASGVCKVIGTCTDGSCSAETNADDGTTCDDGDADTASSTCQSGVCEAASETDPCAGVTCTAASGVCKVIGTCTDGSCSAETNADDGTTCDDGDANTASSTCQSGVCVAETAAADDDTEEVVPPPPPLSVTMTLPGDVTEITSDNAIKTAFEDAFETDMATVLDIEKSRIRVTGITAGSIVVAYTVAAADDGTQMTADALETAVTAEPITFATIRATAELPSSFTDSYADPVAATVTVTGGGGEGGDAAADDDVVDPADKASGSSSLGPAGMALAFLLLRWLA
jgi:hypothetical protein